MAAVRALLADPDVRILTLTGPGGVGKTRLALEVAAALARDGLGTPVVVDLAALTDPELVLPTMARALGVRDDDATPVEDRLAAELAAAQRLVILDNLEQVLAAGPNLAGLAAAAPGLTLLVTSRSRLAVRGEHEVPVLPLEVPPSDGQVTAAGVAGADAVALFVLRARAANPDIALSDANAAAVVEICRRLDGLPLAIELAAARCRLLSPGAILARLSRRLDLLAGGPAGAPGRHRSLRAAVAWSYDLLAPADQALFRRLSVFAGAFSADAAEAVVGLPDDAAPHDEAPYDAPSVLDRLAILLDASLLQRATMPNGEVRLRMLETVREFTQVLLAGAGEEEATRDRHAAWHRDRILLAEREAQGERQPYWFDWMAASHDDLRAAMDWALATEQAELALRLATGPVWYFWFTRGWSRREHHRLRRALELAERTPDAVPTILMAKAQFDDANHYGESGDYPAARARFERLLETMRALGPAGRNGVAGILGNLSKIDTEQGDYVAARARLEEALVIRRDPEVRVDPGAVSRTLANLASTAAYQGEFVVATAYADEAFAIARQFGERRTMASVLTTLGEVAADQGHDARAIAYLDQALGQLRQIGDVRGESIALVELASSALRAGDPRRAAAALAEAFAQQREARIPVVVADALEVTAELAVAAGRPAVAHTFLTAAATLRQTVVAVPYPAVRRRRDRTAAAVLAVLDHPTAERAEIAGRALATDDAVAAATAFLDGLLAPALRTVPNSRPTPAGPAPASDPSVAVISAPVSSTGAILSPRQREVLRLLVDGLTDPEIAHQLGLSVRTVESHVAAILNKLGLHARTAAVAYAVRHSLA